MDSVSPLGAGRGVQRANTSSASTSDLRRSLFESASNISESSNGERNAQATGRFAVQRSARLDGLGSSIDIRG